MVRRVQIGFILFTSLSTATLAQRSSTPVPRHALVLNQTHVDLIADAIGGFDKFELAERDDVNSLLDAIMEAAGIAPLVEPSGSDSDEEDA